MNVKSASFNEGLVALVLWPRSSIWFTKLYVLTTTEHLSFLPADRQQVGAKVFQAPTKSFISLSVISYALLKDIVCHKNMNFGKMKKMVTFIGVLIYTSCGRA
ncbi:MAG: hypothetical protein D8M57_04625 [Candidatus Scalindua sp. AMX11]|nr:MAG: hypothetical protein DWQ00_03970 [Candidatus Scalindua sp.]RZV92376.1 MAG: hypothetical protein EX341_04825 [Candidatus Scalindua sp. SCAELEC01]TDE66099.1 MAG: hypothetical protein D8M57_04625 [Candidatus Scalindua sp. AMX11]